MNSICFPSKFKNEKGGKLSELSLSLTTALHDGQLKQGNKGKILGLRYYQQLYHLAYCICTFVVILQGCATGPRVLIIPASVETIRKIDYQADDYEKTLDRK